MHAGKVIGRFRTRDGRDGHSQSKEDFTRGRKGIAEKGTEWMLVDEAFYLVAEVDGKVVANSELQIRKEGYSVYVGIVGIAIRNGYRDSGIGTKMMKTLIDQAVRRRLKLLVLQVFR